MKYAILRTKDNYREVNAWAAANKAKGCIFDFVLEHGSVIVEDGKATATTQTSPIPYGHEIISWEDFKGLGRTLRTNYKLIRDYPGAPCKVGEYLPTTFHCDPTAYPEIWEKDFKTGDKVVVEGSDCIFIVDDIEPLGETSYVSVSPGGCVFKKEKLRLATAEEIKKHFKRVIKLRYEGGEFEVEVSSEGIYYAPDQRWLCVSDLEDAIKEVPVQTDRKDSVNGYYTFKPSHIDSGCKKQVPVEDWEKVISEFKKIKS